MSSDFSAALYYDLLFLDHDTLTHPEHAGRLTACLELLENSRLIDRLQRPPGRDATSEELARVHSGRHIETMRQTAGRGPQKLDPDTVANAGSFDAAVRAAGACLAATEAVVQGEQDAAFCLTRPPGHHATPAKAMGFCIFNSVAIAAAHARAALGLERVAIVDFDLHHGNGTQDAFYHDGSILYVSTHQYPFYPGSGDWTEAGVGEGVGATLNLPLRPGCGDAEYAFLLDQVIAPKLRAFTPELILVSAGYDAHFADSISGAAQRLSCAGYYALVSRLRDLAGELCKGRIVLALEGGYDLTALAWSVRNSIEALLGEPATPDPVGLPPAMSRAPELSELVERVEGLHGLA